jgi:hypothetical protein
MSEEVAVTSSTYQPSKLLLSAFEAKLNWTRTLLAPT